MPEFKFWESGTCAYERVVTVTASSEEDAYRIMGEGGHSIPEEYEYTDYIEQDSWTTNDEE